MHGQRSRRSCRVIRRFLVCLDGTGLPEFGNRSCRITQPFSEYLVRMLAKQRWCLVVLYRRVGEPYRVCNRGQSGIQGMIDERGEDRVLLSGGAETHQAASIDG